MGAVLSIFRSMLIKEYEEVFKEICGERKREEDERERKRQRAKIQSALEQADITTKMSGHFVLSPALSKAYTQFVGARSRDENNLSFEYFYSRTEKKAVFRNLGKMDVPQFLRMLVGQEKRPDFGGDEMPLLLQYLKIFLNKSYGQLEWDEVTIVAKDDPETRIPIESYKIEPNELMLDTSDLTDVQVNRTFKTFQVSGLVCGSDSRKYFHMEGPGCFYCNYQIMSQFVSIDWNNN